MRQGDYLKTCMATSRTSLPMFPTTVNMYLHLCELVDYKSLTPYANTCWSMTLHRRVRSCLELNLTFSWRRSWRVLSTTLSNAVMTGRRQTHSARLEPMLVTKIRDNLPSRSRHYRFSLQFYSEPSGWNITSLYWDSLLMKSSLLSRTNYGQGTQNWFNRTLHFLEWKTTVLTIIVKNTRSHTAEASFVPERTCLQAFFKEYVLTPETVFGVGQPNTPPPT